MPEGLSNSDFRTILMTPRRDDGNKSSGSSSMGPPSSKPKKADSSKKRSFKGKTISYANAKYRDRAEERRKGVDPDMPESEAAIPKVTGFQAVPPPEQKSEEERKQEEIEKSKYLGGDIEHTHLVKGLDRTLLERVKEKMEEEAIAPKEEEEAEPTEKEEEEETYYKVLDLEPKDKGKEKIKFEYAVSQNIYRMYFDTEVEKTVDSFLPGRTTYTYDLEDPRLLPSIVLRAREDLPTLKESCNESLDESLMELVSGIMNFLREDPKNRKKAGKKPNEVYQMIENKRKQAEEALLLQKKQEELKLLLEQEKAKKEEEISVEKSEEKMEETPQAPPEDDDDDIFADVGDYVPVGTTSDAPKTENKLKPTSYFGTELPEKEESVLPESLSNRLDELKKAQEKYTIVKEKMEEKEKKRQSEAAQAQSTQNEQEKSKQLSSEDKKKGMATVFRRDEKATARRETDVREKDPTFVSDSYMECYPGTYETSFMEVDDEAEDISKMDMGKRRLKRKDFLSEEAWSSYNENREALPKAAFQFGVKMSDGRKTKKTQKDLGKKLEKDLKKINEIIKKKENNTSTFVPTAQEARKKQKFGE